MPKRYWLFICALGLGVWHPCLAQTTNDQTAPQRSPVPESRPPSDTPKDASHVTSFMIPVHIEQTADEAKSSADNERKALEHDAADLDAQLRAAKAAEDGARAAEWQKWPTVAQVVLGVLAAAGLIASLILNYLGTRAAMAAAETARADLDFARRNRFVDSRPWVLAGQPEMWEIPSFTKFGITYETGEGVRIGWKNSGSRPAVKCIAHIEYRLAKPGFDIPPFEVEEQKGNFIIGPGLEFFTDDLSVHGPAHIDFVAGKRDLIIYSRVTYADVLSPNEMLMSECTYRVRRISPEVQENTDDKKVEFKVALIGPQNTAT